MKKINSQEAGFLWNFLDPWMKFGLTLMKNVLTSLAKSVLIPLGLTTAVSAADGGMQKMFMDLESLHW